MATNSKQVFSEIRIQSCIDDLGRIDYRTHEVILNENNAGVVRARRESNTAAIVAISAFLLTMWAVANKDEAYELFGDWDGAESLYTLAMNHLGQANIVWN